MSQFRRVKSELFQGGIKDLKSAITAMRGIDATPVEREFDQKWAVELRDRVKTGLAVSFHWAVADVAIDGKSQRMRMNGQHSSWALAELLKGNELPDDLAIHLDTYSADGKDAAIQLFRQFDARKSARSKEDISGAYQMFHENIKHCNRTVAKLAVEGVNWYRREVDKAPGKSGDEIYDLFNEERLHPFVILMDEVITLKCPELKRCPVLAAAFGTWWEDAKASAEFWRSVAQGNGDDAASDLDTELLRIKEEKEKTTARDLYAKCAKAWLAHQDGNRVTNFKVNTKKKDLPRIAA